MQKTYSNVNDLPSVEFRGFILNLYRFLIEKTSLTGNPFPIAYSKTAAKTNTMQNDSQISIAYAEFTTW